MQQFYRFKRAHPGCILLFRIGDFYETFDDDAVTISKALGLTLTKRTEGLPMAGVPYHQIETYLKRLVAMGYRVAVGDQIEDAAQAKGLVQRAVTRVATPGTIVEEALLDDDASVRVAAIAFGGSGDDPAGAATFAIAEATTGDFVLGSTTAGGLIDELTRRRVREVIFAALSGGADAEGASPRVRRVLEALGVPGSGRPSWHFRMDEAREAIFGHFGVSTVAGFGLADDDAELAPAGALVRYLKETQTPEVGEGARPGFAPRGSLAHLRPPRRERASASCILDAASLRALEVERVLRQGVGAGVGMVDRSLVGLFIGSGSGCRTSMGKRLVRDWLCRPSCDLKIIEARHAAVALLVEDTRVARELSDALDGVQDVARIAGRIALDRATPRDLVALGQSLGRAGAIVAPIENAPAFTSERRELAELAPALGELSARILASCVEAPPAHLREGGLFRDGFDAALDEARLLQRDAGAWLAAYQERLARELNLPGIKVGYNKIFGYYIELTAAQARGEVPRELERKQTLKNAERYTTAELREFERKVTTAESRAVERERVLFQQLCDAARARLRETQAFAEVVAGLDALGGFAHRARARGWTRPTVLAEPVLELEQARHPVLEEVLGADFVPNDLALRADESPASLALITGPNMAGKSTFIRQIALNVLLAHAGSFVPAVKAKIGLTDRIFTRIGADDALHAGQSTFMVEMTETANILNNATPASLVVLDEIGRGTSTLDGLSLAWAIAEHLGSGSANKPGPRCLFATHYHELTDLEESLAGRVANLHVAVREWTTPDGHQEIVFLHRILPGRTDQSYGVHVARLAGIPAGVIGRAKEILASLAVHHGPGQTAQAPKPSKAGRKAQAESQLSLFREYVPHPAVNELRELKIESLTPLQAFDALRKLRDLADRPE